MTRSRKRLLGLILVPVVVLVGVGVAFVYGRTRVVQMALDRVLAGAELEEARIGVDRVGLGSAGFSGLILAGEFWRIEADSIRLDYDWRHRRIELLDTGPSRVTVDLDTALAAPSTRTLDELADLVEEFRRSLPEVPFSLGPTELAVRFRGEEERFELTGQGRLDRDSLLEGAFQLTGALGELDLEVGRSEREAPLFVGGRLVMRGDPLAAADRFYPEWRGQLPSGFEIADPELGSLEVAFSLLETRLRLVSLNLEGGFGGLDLVIHGNRLAVGQVESRFAWHEGEDPEILIGLNRLTVDSDVLRASTDLIEIRGIRGEALAVDARSVEFAAAEASGHLGLAFATPWPEAFGLPDGASLTVDLSQLEVGGLDWNPIRIGARTAEGAINVELPRLQCTEPGWPLLADVVFRAPVDAAGIGAVTGGGRLVFAEAEDSTCGTVTGSNLILSIALSGIATDSAGVDLRIAPAEGGGFWKVPGHGVVEAEGSVSARVRINDPDEVAADLKVSLGRTVFRSESAGVELSGLDLAAALPACSRETLVGLRNASWLDRIRWVQGLPISLDVIGDRLAVPGGLWVEWFDLALRSGDPSATGGLKPILGLEMKAARLQVGVEQLNSVHLRHEVTIETALLSGAGWIEGLFDGAPLRLSLVDEIGFGPDGGVAWVSAGLTMEPLRLEYSDLVARHLPRFSGLSLNTVIEGNLSFRWSPDESWDAGGSLAVSEGSLFHPAKNIRLEGLEGEFAIGSLRNPVAPAGQVWSFDRLAVTDLELLEGRVVFGMPGPDQIAVSELTFEAFKGRFRADPFVYSIPDQSVELVIRVDGLDAGAVVDHLDFFDGHFEGRLSGSVPFYFANGRIEPRRGHLELDGSVPAVFSYQADGLLTKGEPSQTLTDKLRLLPLRLAEEGLKDLKVASLTVDLFDPDLPSTPVRILLSGEAVTTESVIPYVITTNVNGSVAEVLNFLFRLTSL